MTETDKHRKRCNQRHTVRALSEAIRAYEARVDEEWRWFELAVAEALENYGEAEYGDDEQ